jgi:hypothetical protein
MSRIFTPMKQRHVWVVPIRAYFDASSVTVRIAKIWMEELIFFVPRRCLSENGNDNISLMILLSVLASIQVVIKAPVHKVDSTPVVIGRRTITLIVQKC